MSLSQPVPRGWLARESGSLPRPPGPGVDVTPPRSHGPSGWDPSGWDPHPHHPRRPLPKPGKPVRAAYPRAGRMLAAFVVVAFFVCEAIEPAPNGTEPVSAGWMDAVAAVGGLTILAGLYALVRARPRGAALGVASGVSMLAFTAMCPSANHHQMGSFIVVQAALSGLVVLASLGLLSAERRALTRG